MALSDFCNETIKEQEDISKAILDLCEKAYQKGVVDRGLKTEMAECRFYKRGYADGQKCHEETVEDIYRKGFENGLEQAWECARKIYKMTAKEVIAIFGGCSLWVDYSASEAIAKIKEYEGRTTRQSIIKSQLEDIITGFTEPVTSQEIIDALVQIKEKQND